MDENFDFCNILSGVLQVIERSAYFQVTTNSSRSRKLSRNQTTVGDSLALESNDCKLLPVTSQQKAVKVVIQVLKHHVRKDIGTMVFAHHQLCPLKMEAINIIPMIQTCPIMIFQRMKIAKSRE